MINLTTENQYFLKQNPNYRLINFIEDFLLHQFLNFYFYLIKSLNY